MCTALHDYLGEKEAKKDVCVIGHPYKALLIYSNKK